MASRGWWWAAARANATAWAANSTATSDEHLICVFVKHHLKQKVYSLPLNMAALVYLVCTIQQLRRLDVDWEIGLAIQRAV